MKKKKYGLIYNQASGGSAVYHIFDSKKDAEKIAKKLNKNLLAMLKAMGAKYYVAEMLKSGGYITK